MPSPRPFSASGKPFSPLGSRFAPKDAVSPGLTTPVRSSTSAAPGGIDTSTHASKIGVSAPRPSPLGVAAAAAGFELPPIVSHSPPSAGGERLFNVCGRDFVSRDHALAYRDRVVAEAVQAQAKATVVANFERDAARALLMATGSGSGSGGAAAVVAAPASPPTVTAAHEYGAVMAVRGARWRAASLPRNMSARADAAVGVLPLAATSTAVVPSVAAASSTLMLPPRSPPLLSRGDSSPLGRAGWMSPTVDERRTRERVALSTVQRGRLHRQHHTRLTSPSPPPFPPPRIVVGSGGGSAQQHAGALASALARSAAAEATAEALTSTLDALQLGGGVGGGGGARAAPPLPNSPTPGLGELWRDSREKDETIVTLRADLSRVQRERDDAFSALERERQALWARDVELAETKAGLEKAVATAKELREKIAGIHLSGGGSTTDE